MYIPQPCVPSPCGANAICKERNGAGSCSCLPNYIGNPYEGCRPECVLNSDCVPSKSCVQFKCEDPCPGTCGQNAVCQVINHVATCNCLLRFTGDPFRFCREEEIGMWRKNISYRQRFYENFLSKTVTLPSVKNPCQPSPCGANSVCKENNGQAVCSCLPEFRGSPPGCRPECVVSAECPFDRVCVNQKCINPCPDPCGRNAICRVINRNPICSCQQGFTGDAFTICFPVPRSYYRYGFILKKENFIILPNYF